MPRKLSLNTDLPVEDNARLNPTVAGLLLFGLNPNRYLPQAGITATAYKGTEPFLCRFSGSPMPYEI
jgi:ATP-dependent DNA helicase RecG